MRGHDPRPDGAARESARDPTARRVVVAPAITRYIDHVAYEGADVRTAVLDAHVRPGDRVVDLCCGTGTSTRDVGVDTSAAAKVFGKKFACGSALQKGKNGIPDQIEIQGNCFEVLPEFILEKFKDIAIEDVVSKEGK